MVNSGSFTSDSDRSGKTNYQQISDATNVSQSADSGDATDVASKTECSKTADNDDQPHVEPAQSANDERKHDADDSKGSTCCGPSSSPSVPGTSTDVGDERTKTPRKMLCLYCERSFVSANLRQKHVERAHSTKPNRRVSARRQNQLSTTPCGYCDKLNDSEHTLSDLFRHYVQQHSTRYFGCLICEERFLTLVHLSDHNSTKHQLDEKVDVKFSDLPQKDQFVGESIREATRGRVRAKMEEEAEQFDSKRKSKVKDVRGKKIGVKTSKIALKRSKRLQAQAKEMEMQKKRRDRKHSNNNKTENNSNNKQPEKAKSACVNPYPEFDSFYRVKKITDHSIDNLKISSLTFDDVFDKAFFNRIKCNIEENLLHHIDGKLFKNEESESRISNFEKEVQNGNQENYGCELSLNAITPVASLSLNSQFGEDFESQIEYGAKPSKKKSQSKNDEVHYKYFTRRKYQASILQQKENRDLSKLDMWTQMVVKERQERMANNKKTQKEIDEYTSGHEYKNKIKREELNRILDRRGPFEDLKEELSKKTAFDKLNLSSGNDVSQEVFTDVREVLNDILNRVYEATKEDDVLPELDSRGEVDHRQIPSFLDLRRKDWSAQEEIDKSDRIALICSSQETENFEMPTNKIRPRNELVELTGEWARSRMYICAACGGKFSNMKYLLDHKNLYHQNVWVQHYEFVGNQSELYRHLSIPGLGKVGVVEETVSCKQWKRSESRTCAKCAKQCNSLGELHRHVLECGGDWTWMLARKKCKYRPFGAKSRRKRKGLVRRTSNKQKTDPTEKKTHKKPLDGPRQRPSDADTIQRMLANLPAKRSRRSLISLRDVVFKSRKNKERNASQSRKIKCPKQATTTSNNGPGGEGGGGSTTKSVRNLNKVLSSRILDFNSSLLVKRKLKNMQQGRKSTAAEDNNSAKADTNDTRKSTKEHAPPDKKKTLTRKILTSRLNIKNFFPIRKKSMETVSKGSVSAEGRVSPRNKKKNRTVRAGRDSDYASKLQHLKTNKKGGLKGFVRALSLRKRHAHDDDLNQVVAVQSMTVETKTCSPKKSNRMKIKITKPSADLEEKTDSNSTKKRKLHRRMTEIINKVKKTKTEKKVVQDQPFLEEKGVISEPLPEKTVVTPAEVRDSIIAKKDLVPIVPMPDSKENPPIPETIFNLTNSEEKSLQAKGELDFDQKSQTQIPDIPKELPLITITTEVTVESKEEPPDIKVDQMTPMTIDTNLKSKSTPMSSPNMKGKIKKPNRGLNDCIAMLTSKLQLKDEKTFSLDSLFGTSSPVTSDVRSQEHHHSQSKPQKTECILKIPTFRATKSPVVEEETALDLSKKSYTNKSSMDLKSDTIEETINKVIEGVIEHKCKEVLTEKLAVPTWPADIIQPFQTSPTRRSNKKTNFTTRTHVDDTIDFVVYSSSTWYDNKTTEVKIAPTRRTRRKKNSDDNLIKDIIFGKDKLIIAPSSSLQELPLIARIKENEMKLQWQKLSEEIENREAVKSMTSLSKTVIGEDANKCVNEICDNGSVSCHTKETIQNECSCQVDKSTISSKDTCCASTEDPDINRLSEQLKEEPKINQDKEDATPSMDMATHNSLQIESVLTINDLIPPNKINLVDAGINRNNEEKLDTIAVDNEELGIENPSDNGDGGITLEIDEPVKMTENKTANFNTAINSNNSDSGKIERLNENSLGVIETGDISDKIIDIEHVVTDISQTVESDSILDQMSKNDQAPSPKMEQYSNKEKSKSKKNSLDSTKASAPETSKNCVLSEQIISEVPTLEKSESKEPQSEVENITSKFNPSESDDDLPLAVLLRKKDKKEIKSPLMDDLKENHLTEEHANLTLSDVPKSIKKKQKKSKTGGIQGTEPVDDKASDNVAEDEQPNLSEPSKNVVQEPIKILINAQRTRRKSKSSKKLDKTDNDLFKDFSLVINKKTKRIPPSSIVDDSVCDDILDTSLLTKLSTDNIRKPTEPYLNDTVEEMDMELEDIPINASIIERNEVQNHNTAKPVRIPGEIIQIAPALTGDQASSKTSSVQVKETCVLNETPDLCHMKTSDLLMLCKEAYIDMSNDEAVEAQIAAEVSTSIIQVGEITVESTMDKSYILSTEDSGFMEKSYEEPSPRKKRNSRTTSGVESSTDDSIINKNENSRKKRGRPLKHGPKLKSKNWDDSLHDPITDSINCMPEINNIPEDVSLKKKNASKRRSKSTTHIPDSPYFKSSKIDKDSSVKIILHKSKSELSLTQTSDEIDMELSTDRDQALEQNAVDVSTSSLNIKEKENLDKSPIIDNTSIKTSSESDNLYFAQPTLNSVDLPENNLSLHADKDEEVTEVQEEFPKMKIKLNTTLSLENNGESFADSFKNEISTQPFQDKIDGEITTVGSTDKTATTYSEIEVPDKKNGDKITKPISDSEPVVNNGNNIINDGDSQTCSKELNEMESDNGIVMSKKKSGKSQKKKKMPDDLPDDDVFIESSTLNRSTDNQSQNKPKKSKKPLPVADIAANPVTDESNKQNSDENLGFKSRRCRKIIDYNEENLVKQALGEAANHLDPTKKVEAIKENKRPKVEHSVPEISTEKVTAKVSVSNKASNASDSSKTLDSDEISLKISPKTLEFTETTDIKQNNAVESKISDETSKSEGLEEKAVEEIMKITKTKKSKKTSTVKEVEKADAVISELIINADTAPVDTEFTIKDFRNRRIRKTINYNEDNLEKSLIEKAIMESEVSKKASKKRNERVTTNSKDKNESVTIETDQSPVPQKTEGCAPKIFSDEVDLGKNDDSPDVSAESVLSTPVEEKKRKKRSRSDLKDDDNITDSFTEKVQDLVIPEVQQLVKDTEFRKPKKPKNNMDLDISNILDLYDSSDNRRSSRTRKSLTVKNEDPLSVIEKEKSSDLNKDIINKVNKKSELNDEVNTSHIFENLNRLVMMEDDILEDKLLVSTFDIKSFRKAKSKKHKSNKEIDIIPLECPSIEDNTIPKLDTLIVDDVIPPESVNNVENPLTIPMETTPQVEEAFPKTKPKKSKSNKSKSMIFLENMCEIFDGTLDIPKPQSIEKEDVNVFSELPLNDIITSSEMDIAPVLDEIDKSLESEDIYEFADESNKITKGKQSKLKTKSKLAEEQSPTKERYKRSTKTKALEYIHDKTSDMETPLKITIAKKSDIVNEDDEESEYTEDKSQTPIENAYNVPVIDEKMTEETVLNQQDEEANKTEQNQMNENLELRRSRRGSRKVASYNENDLIDPLIDALEKRRSHAKKDKSVDKSKKEIIKDDSDNLKITKPLLEVTEHLEVPIYEDDVSLPKRRDEHIQDSQEENDDLGLGQEKVKDIDKIYEFTEDSPENTEEIRELFSKTKKRFQPKRDSIDSENVVNITDSKKIKTDEKIKDDQDQSRTNYCDICKKSFIRMENLVKHKTTLTHISKLSELEAREAEKKTKEEHFKETEKETGTSTPQPIRVDIDITDILQQPEAPTVELEKQVSHTNSHSVNLVDIISHVLNKPVLETYTSSKASYPDISKPDVRQYKSLAERKSFDGDSHLSSIDVQYMHPVISKTSILEKQINLLENIIGSNLEKAAVNEIPEPTNNFIDDISSCSNNSQHSYVSNPSVSNENSELISEVNNVHSDFVKPTQYEEISLDSTLAREDPKLRKILNRDEELFLECCSLLKSGSEVSNSNYPKNCNQKPNAHPVEVDGCDWTPGNKLIQRSEEAHEYSDNSRTPTPLGDTYDDDASNSNTISSNWNLNSEKPPAENRSFSFEEVISKEEHESETGISFGEMLTKGLKNQFESSPNFPSRTSISSLTPNSSDEKKDDSDCSCTSKKIITKGARKVFEGLKVSIPTEELNLDLINQSPLNKKVDIERALTDPEVTSPPPKPRPTRKSKPVKKSQVGSNLFFKVNKKKASPKPPAMQNERQGLYNFEETQCNSDNFIKTNTEEVKFKDADVNKYLSDNDSLDYTDSNGADARSLSTVSSVSAVSFKKPEIAPENITKKKCMIMGKIFKNAAKSKMDEIDEELRNIPEIPEIDNLELVENYVRSCQNISSPLPPPNFQQPLEEVPKKPKMTEEEMNLLFDKLLGKEATENSTPVKPGKITSKPSTPKVPKSDKPSDPKKKCNKSKNRKRTRVNSESSDDEFNISKTIRKRSNKKNNDDSGINLELELKECIGVASRKSQRKCTSGKQNVLVEYWSSDEEAFEAMLESQKMQSSKEEERKKADNKILDVPEESDIVQEPVKENAEVKPVKTKQVQKKKLLTHKKTKNQNRKPQDSNSSYSSSTSNRRKRAAVNPLYHWSSSSEDESQSLIEIKPIREEDDDEEDRPIQHGWIVGDSPKKLVTMLALTKGKKTEVDSVKEQGKRRTSNTVS